MRIRQIRPEFWSDETVAALTDPVRLFYIGLWGVADDAGWLEWQPRRIGALLYPYRPQRRREADIASWSEQLAKVGRLRLLDCGCGHIPTLARHQRVTGKQSFQYAERHFKHRSLTDKQSVMTDSPVTERNVTERNVTRAPAREAIARENGAGRFAEQMAAHGAKRP